MCANQVGVQINRAVAGPIAFGADPGDNLLIGLVSERGPADVPTLIGSFSRFQSVFGGATPFTGETKYSSGWEILKIFFSKTKVPVYVTRIVGSSAIEAYVDLEDRAGAPVDTLRVYGKGEGTWANAYDVVVADGTKSDTFKLTVLDGDGATVEEFDNLKMSSSYVTQVNSRSDYIRLEDLASGTAAPDNIPAAGTFNLNDDQAGVDDNEPNAAAVVGTETAGVKTGLKTFRSSLYGRGFLIAPDLDEDSTVKDEILASAEAFYRVPLFSSQVAATPATAKTQKVDAIAFNGGFYYPRPIVKDALTEELKPIPAVAHVAADWINVVQQKGPGKVPAGRDFKIDFVVGLETQTNGQPLIDATVAADLVGNGVNPIYDRDGTGPKVWGGRSTSDNAAWQYLHAGYLWARIAHSIQGALDTLVYEVADELFFKQVEGGIYNFMVGLHEDGAFNGVLPLQNEPFDPAEHAFSAQCDESLLSASDKENGIIRAEVAFKPALAAETIIVTVAKQNQVS